MKVNEAECCTHVRRMKVNEADLTFCLLFGCQLLTEMFSTDSVAVFKSQRILGQ